MVGCGPTLITKPFVARDMSKTWAVLSLGYMLCNGNWNHETEDGEGHLTYREFELLLAWRVLGAGQPKTSNCQTHTQVDCDLKSVL